MKKTIRSLGVLILLMALTGLAAEPAKPPHIVFMVGEPEYNTRTTVAGICEGRTRAARRALHIRHPALR